MKILGKFPSTRLRRVRNSEWMRKLISENQLSTNDLILPIFVREGKNKIEKIKSMPGINRYTVDKLGIIIRKAKKPSTSDATVTIMPDMIINRLTIGFLEKTLRLSKKNFNLFSF